VQEQEQEEVRRRSPVTGLVAVTVGLLLLALDLQLLVFANGGHTAPSDFSRVLL
jgi:hypothetical protein